MALTLTSELVIKGYTVIPEHESIFPLATFYARLIGTGDATAGAVIGDPAFKAANEPMERFFMLDEIAINGPSAMLWSVSLLDGDWDPIFIGAPVSGDTVLRGGTLIQAVGASGYLVDPSKVAFPVLLGFPLAGGTARIRVHLATNTNTAAYAALVRGRMFGKWAHPHLQLPR